MRKPNLFIVGAMKAGTTFLADLLATHPEVCMSQVKEPHHFDRDIDPETFTGVYLKDHLARDWSRETHMRYVREPQEYLELWAHAKEEKYRVESTISYLYSKVAPKAISEFAPDAKIIVLLREPVSRAFSHYQMNLALGFTHLDFESALREDMALGPKPWGQKALYYELGQYAHQVEEVLQHFPRERVMFLEFRQCLNFESTREALRDFLELEPGGFRQPENTNVGISPRSPKLNTALQGSGAKELIRKILPRPMLEKAKGLFYGEKSRLDKKSAFFREISEMCAGDVAATAKLTGLDLESWAVN